MGLMTMNDIRYAVNHALDAAFPDIPIAGDEIKQGLETPYFFVKLLEGSQDQELGTRYRREQTFDIHYFDAENGSMHDMAEQLYDKLELISYKGTVYRGKGMRHEIINGVLHFFVDYAFHVRKQTDEAPKMQTMEQEGNLK